MYLPFATQKSFIAEPPKQPTQKRNTGSEYYEMEMHVSVSDR